MLLTVPEREEPVAYQRSLQQALAMAASTQPGLQGNFEAIVFVDTADKVLGYFMRPFFLDLLWVELEQTIRTGESRARYDPPGACEPLELTQL